MIPTLARPLFAALALSVLVPATRAAAGDYPEPSPYPVAWELKFEHAEPERIVVDVPGQGPRAFWYMTYTVTNETDEEQMFLPLFEMVTRDGQVIRSDRNIPPQVFSAVRKREGNRFLEPRTKISGALRLGEDQAREGVAIWREPHAEMGTFIIFVSGLSGEFVELKDKKGDKVKDKNGDPVILRKTLQLNYIIHGDEVYPGEDKINVRPEAWVMR